MGGVTVEIDYKLTSAQAGAMELFGIAAGERAWVLKRLEGTGARFWRIEWCAHPEWYGERRYADGKRLSEAVHTALAQFKAT